MKRKLFTIYLLINIICGTAAANYRAGDLFVQCPTDTLGKYLTLNLDSVKYDDSEEVSFCYFSLPQTCYLGVMKADNQIYRLPGKSLLIVRVEKIKVLTVRPLSFFLVKVKDYHYYKLNYSGTKLHLRSDSGLFFDGVVEVLDDSKIPIRSKFLYNLQRSENMNEKGEE